MRYLQIAVVAILLAGLVESATASDEIEKTQLLIVAPANWRPEMEAYLEGRLQNQSIAQTSDVPGNALCGEVVALEAILDATDGVDDPERLKQYFFERWHQGRLTHVLLVGDCGVMPVRYMVLDRHVEAAANYSFYPSDLYYADVARRDGEFDDWNAAREDFHADYFGEVRGETNKSDPINFDQIDYRPEIAIGRWPVQTLEQLKTIIDKSLAYERRVRDEQHPGTGRAALLAVDGWVDSRAQLDSIGQRLEGWDTIRMYYADAARDDQTPPPNSNELHAAITDGVGLVFHSGHGEPTGWHRCIALTEALTMQSKERWPILLSAGCSTAVFAPQAPYEAYLDIHGNEHAGTNSGETFADPPPPPACLQPSCYDPTSMGEQLVVGTPGGAVAYFGCTTGSQPCGLTLLKGFGHAIGSARRPLTIGEAWMGAIEHYYAAENLADLQPTDSWYPPSIFFQGMKFVLFGDPSLPIPSRD